MPEHSPSVWDDEVNFCGYRGGVVRPEGMESHIELNFDCTASPTGLKRSEVSGLNHVKIEQLSGTVVRTATGYVAVPQGMHALCLNLKGTLIARAGVSGKLVLIPPRSLTYVRNSRLILQAARGEHVSQLITWPTAVTPLLDHWILTRQAQKGDKSSVRNVACKPIDPHYQGALKRLDEALASGLETTELLVVSFLFEVVARILMGGDQVQLAAVPMDLPDTIKELVLKVRQTPSHQWPLKEAADLAGYSPFHFSRVFKQLVGYGFHEYVDRCRTECAVEMLCITDSPVDLVASTCGFGTTQGLRESVKEYLGLVPSELRAIPEPIDGGD